MSEATEGGRWPSLPWAEWEPTASTLHMWTQIVGKTRLALTPLQSHWWNVPLYVTARGLGPWPCLVRWGRWISSSTLWRMLCICGGAEARRVSLALRAQSVASFYREYYMEALRTLRVAVTINPMPVEIANPIRFDLDTVHASYDPEAAHRFWQVLVKADGIFGSSGLGFWGR
jgi:hypothetical protein